MMWKHRVQYNVLMAIARKLPSAKTERLENLMLHEIELGYYHLLMAERAHNIYKREGGR